MPSEATRRRSPPRAPAAPPGRRSTAARPLARRRPPSHRRAPPAGWGTAPMTQSETSAARIRDRAINLPLSHGRETDRGPLGTLQEAPWRGPLRRARVPEHRNHRAPERVGDRGDKKGGPSGATPRGRAKVGESGGTMAFALARGFHAPAASRLTGV